MFDIQDYSEKKEVEMQQRVCLLKEIMQVVKDQKTKALPGFYSFSS